MLREGRSSESGAVWGEDGGTEGWRLADCWQVLPAHWFQYENPVEHQQPGVSRNVSVDVPVCHPQAAGTGRKDAAGEG